MIYTDVDPAKFVDIARLLPAHGRGAWTPAGIDFGYRYAKAPTGASRIGTVAEKSLAHWAVAAGCHAIQRRLVELKILGPLDLTEVGIFGAKTDAAVRSFQSVHTDPQTGHPLTVDGIVGTSDARALWTPIVDSYEAVYSIPDHLLRGEVAHESNLDPGAVGFYIYYTGPAGDLSYRGVDRGPFQINSQAQLTVSWQLAFDFSYAADWSANMMRRRFNSFLASYPHQREAVLWDAAVCGHNNPSAAQEWAKKGYAPNPGAADYVNAVKVARY